jgi:hypothetical protein
MLIGTILGSSQPCHYSEFPAECGALVMSPSLAITWPQGVLSEEDSHPLASQVHGGVS